MFLTPPDWISDDAINLRIFLQSPTGQKMLVLLYTRRPAPFPDEADGGHSFARARTIVGFELAIAELVSLSGPVDEAEPMAPPDNLPDLDDDTKWPTPPP